MNDDQKKINWKRSISLQDEENDVNDLPLSPLQSEVSPEQDIESLKKEIENDFLKSSGVFPVQENEAERSSSFGEDFSREEDQLPTENPLENSSEEEAISKLREEILRAQKVSEEDFQAPPGIEQTYYSDLSQAMESSEPSTMSELIRRSRFEDEEKKIHSPRSRKNLLFLAGTLIFLLASVGVLSTILKNSKTQKVEIIEGQKVSSLVYADTNTGINLTGVDTARTKQAIRQVTERKHSKDSVDQIYYVEQDNVGNLRRLGIKDVFDRTGSLVPDLLYDNIENTFMHGVYTSDKNYPFLILKPLSYDRAYLGMKEWESTMIDDLSPFLDLPNDANDRSLLNPGFEDSLIKNKNVRVARFLPRSRDRKGISDFLRSIGDSFGGKQNGETEEIPHDSGISEEGEEGLLTYLGKPLRNLFDIPSVFAQTERSIFGTVTDEYGNLVFDVPVFVKESPSKGGDTGGSGQYSFMGPLGNFTLVAGGATLDNSAVYTLKEIAVPQGKTMPLDIQLELESVEPEGVVLGGGGSSQAGQCSNGQIVCYNNNFPGQVFDSSHEGEPGYYCIDIVGGNCQLGTEGNGATTGNQEIGQISYTKDICFDPISGQRLTVEQQELLGDVNNPYGFCFSSYHCYKYVCIDERTNIEVSSIREGEPGIVCRQSTQRVPYDFEGRKVCRQFTDLLSMKNINQQTLCFDADGTYIPYISSASSMQGVTCIAPQTRSNRLCITQEGGVVNPDSPDAPLYGNYKFCFEPLGGVTTTIDVNDKCSDLTTQEIQQRLAQAAFEIRFLANIGAVLGLSQSFIQTLHQTADFLEQIAYANVLQIEEARQVISFLHDLEVFLDAIDPDLDMPQEGPNGNLNFYGSLRYIIDLVKCTLGIANTLQWSTLDPIPQGISIYAGQSVAGMIPIQQALVLLGLLDPISVTGSLDLVTQDAISQLQLANALQVTGIIDPPTLELLQEIIEGGESIVGNDAIINDYFGPSGTAGGTTGGALGGSGTVDGSGVLGEGQITIVQGLGSYGTLVQNLQVILFAEGYTISQINGVFDAETCQALQEFQADNGLEIADPVSCVISPETYDALNALIREKGYLGSGFALNPQGYLEGKGILEGLFGPGVRDYLVDAAGDNLNEGDVVLLYTFLDENTILIARDEIVINEIIKRRALYNYLTQ
ncbi:MAG: peptidoglycan-binding protein [Candidatus Pacebacteria bacterium]|nr:peptidoglycan-binding protein [Candidatus Paceibacterota bacterium]